MEGYGHRRSMSQSLRDRLSRMSQRRQSQGESTTMTARLTSVRDPFEEVLLEETSSPPPYCSSGAGPGFPPARAPSIAAAFATDGSATDEPEEWRFSFLPNDDRASPLVQDPANPRPVEHAVPGRSPSTTQRPTRQRSVTASSIDQKRASQLLESVPEDDFVPAPAYEIPPPPPPPTLQPLEHDPPPATNMFVRSPSTRSASMQFARPSSTLGRAAQRWSGRLNSVRSVRRARGPSSVAKAQSYGMLEEGEWSDLGNARRPSAYLGAGGYETVQVPEDDEPFEAVGMDLSSWEGPIGLRSMPSWTSADPTTPLAQDAVQNNLVAEYDRLEANGRLTGGLGGGMTAATVFIDPSKTTAAVMGQDPSTPIEPVTPGIGRGMSVRDVGRREARERNEMVMVNEITAGVDIGFLGGDEGEGGGEDEEDPGDRPLARRQTAARVLTGLDQTSYYFPPDPEMPNWKPISMRWPYMGMLILLSVGLGVLQECLYQLSAHRRQRNDGLLKFVHTGQVSTADFFSWKYLPTIVAVTFGVMWQIVDYEVKRLEPYYQLSRPEGALATESLNRDYLTCWPILAPVKALKYRQFAVLYSSIIYLVAGPLIPVLQIGSLRVTPREEDRRPGEFKYVEIHPVWSRLLTTSFLVVGLFGCLLLYQLRRKSGLLSDPNGIAGIAAMANKSHILMDFKDLDTASEAAIHNRLKHRRYNLHKSTIWQGEYIKAGAQPVEQRKAQNPHPMMLRLVAGIPLIVFLLLFMGFIPLLMFVDRVNVVAKRLPWLLTAIASVIKVFWGTLDSDVRMMEPFYILSRRGAPSSTLTLDYTGTIPGWLPVKAVLARHYLVGLVGLGAVMSEVLTVCVSSLGVRADIFLPGRRHGGGGGEHRQDQLNSEETFKSVWVSFTLVMAMLACMILTAALVYQRRRHAFLPREPGTIASVLAFIHQSKMLWDFVDTETMNSRQMTEHLRRKGKTYGLGWFRGRDGLDHCGIDEEPLVTNYRHGFKFTDAIKPWADSWETY